MAKKVDNSFDFLGLRPGENALDVNNIKAAINRNINSDPTLFKAYHSEEIFRPQLEEVQRQKEMERLRNIDVNSFNYLSKKAGFDEGYASNLFNRVQDLSSMETQEALSAYSAISKELNDLKEKGTTSDFGGFDYLADFGEGLFELGKSARNVVSSMFGGQAQFTDPTEYLSKNKDDVFSQKVLDEIFTPDEIYKYAKQVLDRQHKQISIKKFEQENGGADKILNLIESKNRNLSSMNGFDDLLLPVLNNQFTTPGSEYYRGVGGDMTPQDVREFQNYTKELFTTDLSKRSDWSSHIGSDGIAYGKYDLEKEALNDYKSVLQNELFSVVEERRNLLDQDKLKKESKEDLAYQGKITRINSALDKLVAREKNIDQIYGISVGDRSGFIRGTLGSAYMAARDLTTNIFPGFDGAKFDVETQLLRNAIYKPEVIKYDKYGNPVLSNQVFYETASGSKANWSGLFEAGGTMIGDMAPAIATGAFVTRAVGAGLALAETEAASATFAARAVSSSAKAYDKLNKYGNLRLADRISTFGTIYASTKPRIYEQEKKWGGDAEGRATYLAIAEATAEAIGFPDVGVLKVTPYSRSLKGAAKTAAGINLTRSELAKAYLKGGTEFTKNALKANLVESFEEEMSLLGETLVGQAYADEYAKAGREQTEFSAENILDTFVESFKGGLLYSGLMTGMSHYRATRRDNLLDQAEYEAALNPELFKAKLKETHLKNPAELSEKQLADAIVTIDSLSNTFKSLSQIDNLRDLNTFFEDEDARRNLFTAARKRDVLKSIDFDSLTPEQADEFAKAKLSDKISKNSTKEYNKIRQKIADFVTQTGEKELTKEETLELIKLQTQALKLREAANTIDLRKLNDSQMETLASMGIIQDKDFQFTQEDLDKMIEEVDTEILKTEKRAFEYASMTKAEKAEAIRKAYDKKIADIEQVDNPNILLDSLIKLKRDYEYLEKNVPNINPEILANKQRLLDTYQTKFDSLTQRDESGNNAFESTLRDLDIDKAIIDYNLLDLEKLAERLITNEDHVNKDLAELLSDEIIKAKSQIIDNINKLTGEQKIQALAKLLDQGTKYNTVMYFDKASFLAFLTNEFVEFDPQTNTSTPVTLSANISDEEFEQVRSEVIKQRGLRKSNSMSSTGRVDGVSVPVESEQQEDAMRVLARNASVASSDLDDDGFSEKAGLEKQYADSFLKDKELPEAVKLLKNRVFSLFNEGSARAASLLNAFNKLLTDKDTISFEAQIQQIKDTLKLEISNLRSADKNSKPAIALEGVLAELDLWSKTTKKMVIQNPAADLASLINVEPDPKELINLQNIIIDEEESSATLTQSQIVTKESEIKQLNEDAQRRRTRLLDLTSPVRSNGIETVGESAELNQDPAVKRRVAFIDALATMPDAKIKIVNKRQFLREYLSARYPQKSQADIENDLKQLNTFFATLPADIISRWDNLANQEEILAPVHQILGKEFFDKGAIDYYVKNKAEGLLNNPEVIMTASTKEGKIILEDSYPLELSLIPDAGNTNSKEFQTVPWKLSGRIQGESTDSKILPGDVINAHKTTFENKQALKEFLAKNDKSVLVDFEVSDGVVTKNDSYVTIAETQSPEMQTASLRDFSIPTQPGSRIAGKRYKFSLGRLYFNNNGNPVRLQNTKLNEDEIQAIAELVFNPPTGTLSMSQLDEALFDLINQIDKNNRIVFFPAESISQIQADGSLNTYYEQMLVPSLVREIDGKRTYTKLTKEDFIKELGNYYYKASPAFLSGGARYNESITRFQMKDGVPQVFKQPYLEYIKETHQAPINTEGSVSSLVNKLVYPNTADLDAQTKALNLQSKNSGQLTNKSGLTSKTNQKSTTRSLNPTAPQLTKSVSDTLNMIPYAEINSFLAAFGLPINISYSEAIYDQLVLAIKKDPNIVTLQTARIENNQLVTSEYAGSNAKDFKLIIGTVSLPNGQKYKIFFRPEALSGGLNLDISKTQGGYTASIRNTNTPSPTVTPTSTLTPTQSTTAPVSDIEGKKADIEKTLYGTISGSIPLSQALPNGVYIDLGNGLFAYADKNEKIAAVVDKNNGYIVSKSFWNANTNKWQLPNEANLKDDAKRLGVDEAVYIRKYQDAVNVLNAKYAAEVAALEGTSISNANLETVTFNNKKYTVELAKNETTGRNEIVNIFNDQNVAVDLDSPTGRNVMMQLDWDEINPITESSYISVNDLMDAANQTPQAPQAPRQTKPASAAVFTPQEENISKENKEACTTDRFSQQGVTKVPRSVRNKR